MVAFHPREILGAAFMTQLDTYWSSLPETIADRMEDVATFDLAWDRDLRWAERTQRLNGWRAALIRGTIRDRNAMDHVEGEARLLMP